MAAERGLFWCEGVVGMGNVGERRVVWCGGVHVRLVGLGHTLIVVVIDSAIDVVENGPRSRNSDKKKECNMMMCLLCCFGGNVCEVFMKNDDEDVCDIENNMD